MDDPTISESPDFAKFYDSVERDIAERDDVDWKAIEKRSLDFKKSVQDARLKSASSPSYFIMTINMNSPKSGVTEKRRRFVSILMRSFFSSIIFCQELPGYFETKVVAECGTSGYNYVKNGSHSAVIWRKEDFDGETEGLKTTDEWITKLRDRLGPDASELLSRIAMVKLTSKTSDESVLAVSWHGPHTNSSKDNKMAAFKSLTSFVAEVIKEKGIPSYIIGGDFNLNTLEAELPKDAAVSTYELSHLQNKKQEESGRYISHKDNFIWFPKSKLIGRNVRPFLFEDEGTTTSDFSKDDQAKVEREMAEETDAPARPTDMLDHDPIIGVIEFTSSTVVRSLLEDFERVAIADAKQH